MGAGSFCLNPNSLKTFCKYLTTLPAVYAPMNSASVEYHAHNSCVFKQHTIAPPQYVQINPVIDLIFLKSNPWDASTKHFNTGLFISTGNGLLSFVSNK